MNEHINSIDFGIIFASWVLFHCVQGNNRRLEIITMSGKLNSKLTNFVTRENEAKPA